MRCLYDGGSTEWKERFSLYTLVLLGRKSCLCPSSFAFSSYFVFSFAFSSYFYLEEMHEVEYSLDCFSRSNNGKEISF